MPGVNLTRFKDGRYCLSFHLDGKRRRETFLKIREAQLRKNEVERLKAKGLPVVVKDEMALNGSVQFAKNLLAQNGIAKPLTAVVEEYVAAQESLGPNVSLVEACKAYAQRRDKVIPITPGKLVADYETYLTGQKVSKDHLDKTIKIYLNRFAADFAETIDLITLKDLHNWRANFTSSPRTINNYCNAVKALFNYAQDHGHLPKDLKHEASKLKDIEEPSTEANPFSIKEIALLLTSVDKKSLPYVVLGAFAGIRTAEQKRLYWEKHVRWDTGYFDLTGNVTKKKLRRLVPILPVTAAWLEPYKKCQGPILNGVHPERRPSTVLKKHQLEWRHNGLRDAFGSNRAAIVKNLTQVAMEMGNSPEMVIESYREVVTEEQAAKFWNLNPTEAKKWVASTIKTKRNC